MMVSFVLSFFPRDVLDEILNLIESVSEDFPSYFFIVSANCKLCIMKIASAMQSEWQISLFQLCSTLFASHSTYERDNRWASHLEKMALCQLHLLRQMVA